MTSPQPESNLSWLPPVLGHSLGAAAAGGIVGGLLLGQFNFFGAAGHSPWLGALAGAALGGMFGLVRGLRVVRRRQKARLVAGLRGFAFSDHGDDQLAQRLKAVLGREGFVSLQNVLSGRHAGTDVVFADLVYVATGSKSSSRRVNSVAAFHRSDVSFPRFTLRPEGGLISMMADLVGVEDIDFDSHPEFSRKYHLSGQEPEQVRQLFQPRLLDFLDARPGWEIRGERDRLVILKPGRPVQAGEMDGFIHDALEMFAEFETATHARSRLAPPLPRPESPPGSLIEWARRQAITPAHVESFLQAPPPRQVPRKILFQYLNGSIWFIAILFGFLVLLGCGLAAAGVAASEPIFMLLGAALVIGAVTLLAWIVQRRQRKCHLLTNGRPTQGSVERVEATNVAINGQQRYLAHIRYDVDGLPQSLQVPLYGGHVNLARDAADEGRDVLLLYDPESPRNVVLALQLVTQFPFRT